MSFVYNPSAASFFQSTKTSQRKPLIEQNPRKIQNLNSPSNINVSSSIPMSQRYETDNHNGRINNDFYSNNTNQSSSSSRIHNPNMKLTEMSSDLARLKQQLSKIMNQADKFEKRPLSTLQSTQSSQQSQKQIQPKNITKIAQIIHTKKDQQKNYPSFNNTFKVRPQDNLNRTTDTISYQRQTQSPLQKNRTQSYNNATITINNSNSLTNMKTNDFYLNNNLYSQKSVQKQIFHSGSEKYVGLNEPSTPKQNYTDIIKGNQQKTQPKYLQRTSFPSHNQNQSYTLKLNEPSSNIVINSKATLSEANQVYKYQDQYKPNKVSKIEQKQFNNFISDNNRAKNQQYKPSLSPINNNYFQFDTTLTKKDSQKSNDRHQMVVNKIITEQYTKKLEQSAEYQQLKKKKTQQEFEYRQKIIELQHQKRKLNHELKNALMQKQNLQINLKTQKSQRQTLLRKYNQIQQILKSNKLQLDDYKNKYRILQKRLDNELYKPKSQKIQTLSFDEALKEQFSQIHKYKQQNQQKDQEIMRLKDVNTVHRREIESLNNQIKIEQLKAASQLSESEQKRSINLQDKDNQIRTLKHLIMTLESKLSFAIKQNNTKDAFMVQHLTGKAKTGQQKQYIESFFKKYQVEFPSNKLNQKIKEQQLQIQKLKRTILQIASQRIN